MLVLGSPSCYRSIIAVVATFHQNLLKRPPTAACEGVAIVDDLTNSTTASVLGRLSRLRDRGWGMVYGTDSPSDIVEQGDWIKRWDPPHTHVMMKQCGGDRDTGHYCKPYLAGEARRCPHHRFPSPEAFDRMEPGGAFVWDEHGAHAVTMDHHPIASPKTSALVPAHPLPFHRPAFSRSPPAIDPGASSRPLPGPACGLG